MKYDEIALPQTQAPRGDLRMRPVLGLSQSGGPLLAGVAQFPILDLAQVAPAAGLIAVCRDTPDQVVVLGYVGAMEARAATVPPVAPQGAPSTVAGEIDADGWLVIGSGKAQIRLHPDGRIRIKAEDVTLDSGGRLGLRGAWIDLN